MLTGKIRNTVQALLPLADDHQRLLGLLNGALMNSHHTRFATLAMASVVRRAGIVHLRVTSAGHPAPLIVRADGAVEQAGTRGTLIGAFWDVSSTTARIELAPGETCLFFTDGITEAREDRWGTSSSAPGGWRRRSRSAPACPPRPWWSTSRCSPRNGSAAAATTTWRRSRSPRPTTRI